MWLIDTTTYELINHDDSEDVNYCILSHTWEDDEVSFQDMKDLPRAQQKKGFSKIEAICNLAYQIGTTRAWVDTCCIDKSSSAELTESINSMFRWYKQAAFCVVWLSDMKPDANLEAMSHCKWFTRGWTLQEMIAPKLIGFYDQAWNHRGSKRDLGPRLSKITGVDAAVLESSDIMFVLPVARRMSWAAKRSTTRIEDQAYSLLGIFDVNMPLIYGEGDKAFLRLQESIAKELDDLSLLAWSSRSRGYGFRGAFANSPADFLSCRSLVSIQDPFMDDPSFTVTNKGLQINTALRIDAENSDRDKCYALDLHCTSERMTQHRFGIRLTMTPRGFVRHEDRTWWNPYSPKLYSAPDSSPKILLKQIRSVDLDQIDQRLNHSFQLRVQQSSAFQLGLTTSMTPLLPTFWDQANNRYMSRGLKSFVGFTKLATTNTKGLSFNGVVICGFAEDQSSPIHSAGRTKPWAYLFLQDQDATFSKRFENVRINPDASSIIEFGDAIRSYWQAGLRGSLPPAERVIEIEAQDQRKTKYTLTAKTTLVTNEENGEPRHIITINFHVGRAIATSSGIEAPQQSWTGWLFS